MSTQVMTNMRTLSLWQPWATLVAIGAKKFETRSWPTNYRGPLAIHAAKRDLELAYWFKKPCFYPVLNQAGYSTSTELPLGAVLCVVDLVDCVPTESIRDRLSQEEHAFGDYTDGRYAWKLANVQVFIQPIPARGAQGIWRWVMPAGIQVRSVE